VCLWGKFEGHFWEHKKASRWFNAPTSTPRGDTGCSVIPADKLELLYTTLTAPLGKKAIMAWIIASFPAQRGDFLPVRVWVSPFHQIAAF
jgi:hypothetical protein